VAMKLERDVLERPNPSERTPDGGGPEGFSGPPVRVRGNRLLRH
jgi:hypothetical protein